MEFYNVNDANMYIGSSIVRIGETPIFVYEVVANMVAVYKPLTLLDEDVPLREANVKDLNLLPVPLGYINMDGGAVYLTRQPERRVKQGLSLDRIRLIDGRPARIRHAMPDLASTILGQYPDIKAAHAAAKEEFTRYAFHRHFAVDVSNFVYYKHDKIGSYVDGKIVLDNNYIYLHELIQETFDGLL